MIRIERQVVGVLRHESETGSLLIVGEPGQGKSGSQHDLAAAWIAESRDVVVIAADLVRAESAGQLRDDIGLSRDTIEILQNWPGTDPGLLVIDALDAARDTRSGRTFRNLIAAVSRSAPRWRAPAV